MNGSKKKGEGTEAEGGRRANRLIHEKSPYLLRHAHNPVDWYPWGDEAFEKASREDKPVFLSIGYSTCHWCHVMEHESFEDSEVAALMNEAFVSVKVDREERPDIDGVYMTVCQMMTGGGGWPLTVLLTPGRKPFFAGTYFPPESRRGRVGMKDLIPRVREVWKEKRDEILASSERITAVLKEASSAHQGDALDARSLERAYASLKGSYDEATGGFGQAPKFPMPHVLLFLLRAWKRTGDARALLMVESTLSAMRRGGIFDHLGFGFHRYSTDGNWLVPHFEKMLHDQALMAMASTEAYLATGREEHARTAREVLTYVLRDMTSPEGGFYSAEDADSEGEEGAFYLWSAAEIERALGKDSARLAAQVFGVSEDGNFLVESTGEKGGKNILHHARPLEETAEGLGLAAKALEEKLEAARRVLFDLREKRPRPLKDDKVLVDWNGLMIAAMAAASRAFDRKDYAEAAGKAADFILGSMRSGEGGRLLHRYRDGEAAIPAYARDYAFFIWGLLELYGTTFKAAYLEAALELQEEQLRLFRDEASGGFFMTAEDDRDSPVRRMESTDGAIPSANSVSFCNLLRLGRMTGRRKLLEMAEDTLKAFSSLIDKIPEGHAMFLVGLDFMLGPTFEVVIAGEPEADDTRAMMKKLHGRYLPNAVVLLRPRGEAGAVAALAPFTEHLGPLQGRAAAYVCRDFQCSLPVTDPAELEKLIR